MTAASLSSSARAVISRKFRLRARIPVCQVTGPVIFQDSKRETVDYWLAILDAVEHQPGPLARLTIERHHYPRGDFINPGMETGRLQMLVVDVGRLPSGRWAVKVICSK